MPQEVDTLDEQVISSMLQVDGRRLAADIARELGVPRATVQRRIEALVTDEFITVRAYAIARRIGLPIHVWFELRIALEHLIQVAQTITGFKELHWVGTVSGGSNIVAEGFFSSNRHLHAFFTERLAGLPGIQQIETLHVLSLEKFTFDWIRMRHASEEYRLTSIEGDGEQEPVDLRAQQAIPG